MKLEPRKYKKMSRFIKRDSDGSTIDLEQEQAEHADLSANAKRTTLVNSSGEAIENIIDSNNSTSTPLAGDATFTGTSTDVTRFSNLTVQLFADQDSATDGMKFQFSVDGTNWDESNDFTFTSNETRRFQFGIHANYFRVIFINGSTIQGAFRVQTIFHVVSQPITTIHRISDVISADNSAQLMKTVLTGLSPAGDFKNVLVTNSGNQKISIEEFENSISTNSNTQLKTTRFDSNGFEVVEPRTAFGEVSVAELSPIVQLQFQYNLNADIVNTNTNDTGTATQSDSMVVLQTGTNATSMAELTSKVQVKYNSGQGGLFRGTAVFTTGVANSSQLFGLADIGDGFLFGYSGADFGILKRSGGKPEIRILNVTTKSTTAEDITITLDGDTKTDVTVSDATATDATTTANEIAAADYSDVGKGWYAIAEGTTVTFVSYDAASHSGTYSLSDAVTAVGSFIPLVTGIAPTETFTTQANWNVDTFDGNGASGITLDPTKGNVYQIKYQWLGFGNIKFFIENPNTGNFQLVHQIKYSNNNIIPSIVNPTLPLFASVTNTTNTSNLTLKSSSIGGYIEGRDEELGLFKGTSVDTVAVAATEIPLLSIKNKFAYQSQRNRIRIKIGLLTISNDAKNVIIRVRRNPDLTAASFSDVDTNTSVVSEDTTASAISGGEELFAFALNKNESKDIDLSSLDFKLNPGDVFTITGQSEAAGTTTSVGINWKELF